jgi:hypothetical protein
MALAARDSVVKGLIFIVAVLLDYALKRRWPARPSAASET